MSDMEQTDNSLTAPAPLPPGGDAETTLESTISAADARPGFRFSKKISVLSDPGGAQAETFGALRTHLLAQHLRDGRRSLTICAPCEGIGSTYVAVNLAVAFALAGVNTLLIDANMRDSGVDEYIEPEGKILGLQQCLMENGPPVGQGIQEEVLPNLAVMYSGGVSDNPQELLAGRHFKPLIEGCIRDFEITIVDTPPSNGSADALRIAMAVRYALIVARRDTSYVNDIKVLASQLIADRAKVIGTFLNDF